MALTVVLVFLALAFPNGSSLPVYHPATTYRPMLERLGGQRGAARGCRAMTDQSVLLPRRGPPQPEPPPTLTNTAASSLSDAELEQLLTVVNTVGTEHGGGVAMLAVEEYQGRRRLVYRLAPGPVFRGVRRRGLLKDDVHSDTKAPATDPTIEKHKKLTHSLKMLYEQTPPKPPLTHAPDHLLRPLPHPSVSGAPSHDLHTVTDGLVRNQLRGAWLSFLLMHFLGFLPELPGIPRHKDPANVKHMDFHTLSRAQ